MPVELGQNRCKTMILRINCVTMIFSLILLGCTVREKEAVYNERPVELLYNEAVDKLEQKKHREAIEKFDNVEREHPYSIWATKAQLISAYAQYQINNYDEALLSLERFIQLHPANKDIAYAYYLRALCYYEQVSDVVRDQAMTELAKDAFKELVIRFPNSKYARDARLKLDLTYDHLAGKEMEIGRYYHNQRYYLAAINRFKNVVENFQTTTHVVEALHRLTECYRSLGLLEDAQKTAAVLGHNFPGSEWYIDSYEMLQNKKIRILDKSGKAWYEIWKD